MLAFIGVLCGVLAFVGVALSFIVSCHEVSSVCWVSGTWVHFMCASSHVLVALLCSVYVAYGVAHSLLSFLRFFVAVLFSWTVFLSGPLSFHPCLLIPDPLLWNISQFFPCVATVRVACSFRMPQLRSTNNSLSAGVVSSAPSPSPPSSSGVVMMASTGTVTSTSPSNELALAVANAVVAALHENTAPILSACWLQALLQALRWSWRALSQLRRQVR